MKVERLQGPNPGLYNERTIEKLAQEEHNMFSTDAVSMETGKQGRESLKQEKQEKDEGETGKEAANPHPSLSTPKRIGAGSPLNIVV